MSLNLYDREDIPSGIKIVNDVRGYFKAESNL